MPTRGPAAVGAVGPLVFSFGPVTAEWLDFPPDIDYQGFNMHSLSRHRATRCKRGVL